MRSSLLFVFALGSALAQSNPVLPAFDVASVKPSPRDGQDRININLGAVRHGTATLANTTLSECIRFAYGLSSEEQISGPDWIHDRNLRVDITAKAPPETPFDQILLMTQRLLAERFALSMHSERKAVAHIELIVSRNLLKRSESQEDGPSSLKNYARGRLNYDHLPMRTLAVLLSRQLRQPVLNRTGLAGYFDIDLRWTPEDLPPADAPAGMAEYPDIFCAIQQQLGLKLEAGKQPIEILVIDRAEKVPLGN